MPEYEVSIVPNKFPGKKKALCLRTYVSHNPKTKSILKLKYKPYEIKQSCTTKCMYPFLQVLMEYYNNLLEFSRSKFRTSSEN